MKLRHVLPYALVLSACGVTDEVVVEDPPQTLAEDEAALEAPALSDRVKTAIAKLPADNGWPALPAFEAVTTTPFRVLECASTKWFGPNGEEWEEGPVIMIEVGEAWTMAAHATQTWTSDMRFTLAKVGERSALLEHEQHRLGCVDAKLETVTGATDVFGAFAYAKTLVTPDEPVFVEAKIAEYDEALHTRLNALGEDGWSEADIQELIDIGPPASAEHWAAALAHTQDRPDLAYEIHRRYRPMGYCSRDTRPISTQLAFANVCRDLTRPRCQLALMKDLLAYQVSRRSDMWIGGKPVTYTSRLDALPAEVDKELFVLGLLADFPGSDGAADASISPQFLALASHGSTIGDELDATLTTWVADDAVDAYNRHRFGVALYFLRTYADQEKTPAEHAAAVAKLDGVPAVTALQLSRIQ